MTSIVTSNAGASLVTSTLTQHAIAVGNTANAINSVAVGTTGQILTGNTTADPTFTNTVNNLLDFNFTRTDAGNINKLNLTQSDNTSTASSAWMQITQGGTSGGFSALTLNKTGAVSYALGIASAAATDFVVHTQASAGVTPGTGTEVFKITSAGVPSFAAAPLGISSGGTGKTTGTVTTTFGTSAAPTGTTSTAAYVMMGLGSSWKITPTTYTSVRATINGQMANGTNGDGINIIIAFGTGGAPSNGGAVTGTTVGINTIFTDLTGLTTNGAPFCKDVIITGLTPGTAYWIDLQCKAVTGGTASVLNLEFTAQELIS